MFYSLELAELAMKTWVSDRMFDLSMLRLRFNTFLRVGI